MKGEKRTNLCESSLFSVRNLAIWRTQNTRQTDSDLLIVKELSMFQVDQTPVLCMWVCIIPEI